MKSIPRCLGVDCAETHQVGHSLLHSADPHSPDLQAQRRNEAGTHQPQAPRSLNPLHSQQPTRHLCMR